MKQRILFLCLLASFTVATQGQVFKFKTDSLSGVSSSVVYLPIRANNFIDLVTFQGTVTWNPAVATLDTIATYSLAAYGQAPTFFNFNGRPSGWLTFAWEDPNIGSTGGVDWAANDTIFLLKFTLVGATGQSTSVRFNNNQTSLEYSDVGSLPNGLTPDTSAGRLSINSAVPTIATGTITGSPFCAGASVSVPFTVSNGPFNSTNTFTAELSNNTGGFAPATTIGFLGGTTSGVISASIPGGTMTGVGYRIRVIGDNPAVTGTDNGANLTINGRPSTPTVTPSGAQTVCQGDSLTLTSSATSGNTWSTTATTQSISVTSAGSYTVYVVSAGCTSVTSSPVTVTVSPAPATPTISQTGNTLSSSSSSGNQWYLNGNLMSGDTNQTLNITQTGNYTVTVTDSNGCSATSAAFNGIFTGIVSGNEGFSVAVFPNPNHGQFLVRMTGFSNEIIHFSIRNLIGQTLIDSEFILSGNTFEKSFDLSKSGSGIYLAEFRQGERIQVVKLVVE